MTETLKEYQVFFSVCMNGKRQFDVCHVLIPERYSESAARESIKVAVRSLLEQDKRNHVSELKLLREIEK